MGATSNECPCLAELVRKEQRQRLTEVVIEPGRDGVPFNTVPLEDLPTGDT